MQKQGYCFWSHKVQTWLQLQFIALNVEDEICVSTVIDNAKTLYRQAFHQAGHNLGRYRQMLQLQHQHCVLASYLSALQNFRSRSRFRCGCHGFHVDTGQFKQRVDRDQRFCDVCAFDTAEDEHHFVFDCPACCSIRDRFTTIFWGPAPTLQLSLFFTRHAYMKCLVKSGDHSTRVVTGEPLRHMTTGSLPRFCMNVLHTDLCH